MKQKTISKHRTVNIDTNQKKNRTVNIYKF